jgi:hypothetical protein
MSLKKHTIKMFKKYKILALLITLLTGLVFSSSVSAILFIDDTFKCRITYKQLNLINSEEKNVKQSISFESNKFSKFSKVCLKGGEMITKHIFEWLDDNSTNVVEDVTNDMECKEIEEFLIFKSSGSYKACESNTTEMISAIVDNYPDKIGYAISYRNYVNKGEPEPEEPYTDTDPDPDPGTYPDECEGIWIINISGDLECVE